MSIFIIFKDLPTTFEDLTNALNNTTFLIFLLDDDICTKLAYKLLLQLLSHTYNSFVQLEISSVPIYFAAHVREQDYTNKIFY